MKTYEQYNSKDGATYRWFYDYYIKLWTIYKIDAVGNQLGDADYAHDGVQLRQSYPDLKI